VGRSIASKNRLNKKEPHRESGGGSAEGIGEGNHAFYLPSRTLGEPSHHLGLRATGGSKEGGKRVKTDRQSWGKKEENVGRAFEAPTLPSSETSREGIGKIKPGNDGGE